MLKGSTVEGWLATSPPPPPDGCIGWKLEARERGALSWIWILVQQRDNDDDVVLLTIQSLRI